MSETEAKLRSLVVEYAGHVHWRCGHQDRWPWVDGDCKCGLVKALRELGFDPDIGKDAPIARD